MPLFGQDSRQENIGWRERGAQSAKDLETGFELSNLETGFELSNSNTACAVTMYVSTLTTRLLVPTIQYKLIS